MVERLKNGKFALVVSIYALLLCIFSVLGFNHLYELFSEHKIIVDQGPLGPEMSDFGTHYSCGVLARENWRHRIDVYDPNEQLASMNAVAAPAKLPFCTYVPYPPYFFTLISCLSTVPADIAWLIYISIAYTAIFTSLALLSRVFIPDLSPRIAIAALTIASAASWISAKGGDSSLYLLPSVTFFWIFLKEKNYFAAAASSFMTLIKVQYFPFIFIAGIFAGGRKFFVGITATALALVLTSWANLGLENLLSFPKAIAIEESPQVIGSNPHLFQTLRGCLYLWAGADTHLNHVIATSVFLASISFCAWLWKFWYAKVKENEPFAFEIAAAITLLLCLSFSLHTYAIDYLLIGTVAILLWRWSGVESTPLKKAIRTLLLLAPALSWIFSVYHRAIISTVHLQPYTLLSMPLLILVLASQRRTSAFPQTSL